MAIIMIFELTLDYQIILPLMLACVVGYYTSVSIEKRSIYAEALQRKGAGDYRQQLAELHVRDLMKPNPLAIQPTARFAEIGEKFIASPVNYLYVTDNGRFVGAVSLHDIKRYLNSPTWPSSSSPKISCAIVFPPSGLRHRSPKRWNVSPITMANVSRSLEIPEITGSLAPFQKLTLSWPWPAAAKAPPVSTLPPFNKFHSSFPPRR